MSHSEYCYEDECHDRDLRPWTYDEDVSAEVHGNREYDDEDADYGDDEDNDYDDFADPGGNSALRAATKTNPPQPPMPYLRRAEPAHPRRSGSGLSVQRMR